MDFLLSDYLNVFELDKLIQDGYVTKRKHQELPLFIYNYTPKAAYDFKQADWTDTLLKCRGLIATARDQIISVCQPKFFNLDPETHIDQGDLVVFDKLDGSMGIFWYFAGEYGIATRGSFHSEQAEWATKFIKDHPEYYDYLMGRTVCNRTPHVEIIYKENQIVLDYDYEDLVMLGEMQIVYSDGWQTQWVWPLDYIYDEYPGRVAERFYAESWRDFVESERNNSEGYVLFYPKTERKYKIKHQHYMELHRAVANLNPRYIWEQMVAGTVDQFIMDLPNEFQEDAQKMRFALNEQRTDLGLRIISRFGKLVELGKFEHQEMSKKEFAALVMQEPVEYRAALFFMFDNRQKEFRDYLWKMVKP